MSTALQILGVWTLASLPVGIIVGRFLKAASTQFPDAEDNTSRDHPYRFAAPASDRPFIHEAQNV